MPCSCLDSLLLLLLAPCLWAGDKPPSAASAPTAKTVEQIADSARKSVVVITFSGRGGKRQGLGTGFVLGAEGLIATNLHVLGEARPIQVRLANGKTYDVTSVHASDRALDLALIRIDAKDLSPLELGDSDRLKDGQAVVALGNPLGLTHSVVSGVVSARREIDGRPMIQLAMPIEPGNSGGPVMDMTGKVHGIVTMKSLLKGDVGFAVPINLLKPLIKAPNPMPMARWLTIGALDPKEWKTVFDAHWKQRAGKIMADGLGNGFGGRSLCLSQQPTPALPFELAVTVKLDDEAGAAGLAFYADGADKHYGFYPSAGQLRLTRFDGPDVFSWKILVQESSSHYRPGDWNTLKVRLEKGKISCYVNDHLVTESADTGLTEGSVGLAKFRDTRAEFKNFRVAKQIPSSSLPAGLVDRINRALGNGSPQEIAKSELVDALIAEAPASMAVLRARAQRLDQQAAQLRQLAVTVHQKRVQAELVKTLQPKEEQIDLLRAALLVAQLDNDELDIETYVKEVERLAGDILATLPKNVDEKTRLAALNKYLFQEHGFHGSRSDYYNQSNSYLNEVIDDREGLPITLSVLYMEVGRRIGLKIVGIGLPSHFVVQHLPAKGEPQLIDVFAGGQPLSQAEARQRIELATQRAAKDEDFAAVHKKSIIVRMLHNLLGTTQGDGDVKHALRYLDPILTLEPDSAGDRLLRAAARFQNGDRPGSLEDVDWILEHQPDGVNLQRVMELRRVLTKPER
jgi:serine protease Do